MFTEEIQAISDQLVTLVQTAPLWVSLTILLCAAFVEYIFPPFPGDTVMLAGGFFAAKGALPMGPVFFILFLGGVLGILLGWYLGYLCADRPRVHAIVEKLFGRETFDRFERVYAKYGAWIMILNRFFPAIRGAFTFASGMAKMPLQRVVLFGSVSTILWNVVLISAGYFFGNNFESMLDFFGRYTLVVLSSLGAALICWFGIYLYRKYTNR